MHDGTYHESTAWPKLTRKVVVKNGVEVSNDSKDALADVREPGCHGKWQSPEASIAAEIERLATAADGMHGDPERPWGMLGMFVQRNSAAIIAALHAVDALQAELAALRKMPPDVAELAARVKRQASLSGTLLAAGVFHRAAAAIESLSAQVAGLTARIEAVKAAAENGATIRRIQDIAAAVGDGE